MGAQRGQPSQWLRCRETPWWKSIALPPSPASDRQRSLVHATQLEVEPPRFFQHGWGNRWFGLVRFDLLQFDPGATEIVWRESHSWRRRASERFWKDR